jgi:3-isopropylmalate dehydrogenase
MSGAPDRRRPQAAPSTGGMNRPRDAWDIVVLPGDGIGPEVTDEAVRVLDWFVAHRGVKLRMTRHLFGSAAWTAERTTMPDRTWTAIMAADALLFGATGSLDQTHIPPEERRKGALLTIRRALDVFANLRPVKAQPALAEASPFKARTVAGTDLVFVRELTAGVYFGTPRGIETLPDGTRRGVNTHSYTETEIARAARFAFDLARTRRNHVTSVDKANVMEAGRLWRDVVTALHAAEFPDVTLDHMLADNCALQLGRAPTRFDVIVTDNLFGDLLSDCAGAINGSLGMLPSAALSASGPDGRRRALYEPIHGSVRSSYFMPRTSSPLTYISTQSFLELMSDSTSLIRSEPIFSSSPSSINSAKFASNSGSSMSSSGIRSISRPSRPITTSSGFSIMISITGSS